MSATQQTKYSCSCGRTFANEQILKYHERVSNHAPAQANAEAPAQAAAEADAEEANPLAGLAAAVAVAAQSNSPVVPASDSSAMLMGPSPIAQPVSEPVLAPVETEAARAEKAYLAAIDILRSKRAEQDSYDRNLAAGQAVEEFVDFAGDVAFEAARVGQRAMATGLSAAYQVCTKVVMLLIVFLLTASMFTAGIGLVTTVADSGNPGGGGHTSWTTVARV